MYKDAFKRYFKNFQSSMFHVVPFKQAVTGEVVKYAWNVLNVGEGHGEMGNLVGGNNQKNHHDYPDLHKEMPAPLLQRYKSFMYEVTGPGKIADVLKGSGAHLYGHGPAGTDPHSIEHWLAKNW